ncbi:hypothetical protein FH972_000827 [Carpinus fangiana]|uniref:Uncharacterized protein n=1 Tax=Carpinus fangiana TaxID=176857 RepID=A0A5N6Q9X8_9ROSI|nr:hypothetical protein FH972_000827 [Carpinus fangiana]
MASKTNILPQPLDFLIGEIGCGDGNGGGGVWFWKVFGEGGFGGWRRKRKRNIIIIIINFVFKKNFESGLQGSLGAVGTWAAEGVLPCWRLGVSDEWNG